MPVERLAQPVFSGLPLAAALRRAFDIGWWLIRAHVADAYLLPRDKAVAPPPEPWLGGWPRARR